MELETREAFTHPLSPEQLALLAAPPNGQPVDASALRHVVLLDINGPLDGPIDEPRLQGSVADVLRQHSVLRSAFRPAAGYRGLRVHRLEAIPPLDWRRADFAGRTDTDTAAELADWLNAFGALPLAVGSGRVLRCAWVRTSATRATLALAVSALVADGASLLVIADQIAAAYLDGPDPDADVPFQYSQFVEWRQELAEGEDAKEGLSYWTRYLGIAASPEPLRLSYRQGGARRPGAARLWSTGALDSAQVLRIAATADALGTRADLLMQAVWWLQLARLNGWASFIGGWQHDCRCDYGLMQGAVGLFEQVLPVVVDVAGDTLFVDWLARLETVLTAHADAQEHWAVEAPLATAQRVVGFSSAETVNIRRGDTTWRVREMPGPMACFELALHIGWRPDGEGGVDGVDISVWADAGCYPDAAAPRLRQQFLALLDNVLAEPSRRLSELSLVGAEERAMLLASNMANTVQAGTVDVGARSVGQHIRDWADKTPNAPAIEAGDQCLNFNQFIARADSLAHWLAGLGVGAGDLVALQLPRSLDLPVAMVAVWRLGAAYLPLDPDWPQARIHAVLADAQPVLLVHAGLSWAEHTPLPCREALLASAGLDEPSLSLLSVSALPEPAGTPADLAYVLYTSGSTGEPKGVPISHGQLLNYVVAASDAMNLGASRRWAMTSTVAADLGNTALFGALFHGACLVVAGADDMKDAEAFARFMAERAIDGLQMVPSHLEALLECETPCLPRRLVLGGEAAPRALLERIARLAPACSVYNHYGPTEATVGVMVHAVDLAAPLPDVLPLSRVLANNHVCVLDEHLQLVPCGALGDVYIGGAQLCRGYLNRAVAPAFVADPLRPGGVMYRSGDLARVLLDGSLQLAGRADHQLKVRGFRVEPAEIEAALLAQPGVRQAVVLPFGHADGMGLAAFLVGEAEDRVDSEARHSALRRGLAALLPEHMWPARYVFLPEFPRLANGKVDRRALAARPEAGEQRSVLSAPPSDALEFVLANGMVQLLGRECLGATDDFFELGGHSLLVIKLVARIRKSLKEAITPAMVFDHSTAQALAAALRAQSQDRAQLERQAQVHQTLAALTPEQRLALEQQAVGQRTVVAAAAR